VRSPFTIPVIKVYSQGIGLVFLIIQRKRDLVMASTLAKPSVATIRPQGYINASNAGEFQSQLTAALLSAQNSGLLVDMAQVDSLDSAGLVALVSGLTLAQRENKRLHLCGVSPAIAIVFELTGLDRVFEIFTSRMAFEAAIA